MITYYKVVRLTDEHDDIGGNTFKSCRCSSSWALRYRLGEVTISVHGPVLIFTDLLSTHRFLRRYPCSDDIVLEVEALGVTPISHILRTTFGRTRGEGERKWAVRLSAAVNPPSEWIEAPVGTLGAKAVLPLRICTDEPEGE